MRAAVWVGAIAVLLTGESAPGQEKKPEVLVKLDGHRGGISALAFDPQVTLIATGSGNGVVRVWDTKTGGLAFRMDPLKQSGARINHLGFAASGKLLSTSSKNAVIVWDLSPPPKEEPKKESPDGKKVAPVPAPPPGPRLIPIVFEDTLGADPLKIGTITGDGHRVYLSSTEGARVSVNSHSFGRGADTSDELKGAFTPWAMSAIMDPESELVAMYGSVKGPERSEPAIAFVGLGDGRIIGRGSVRAPITGRHPSIAFAPDGKWLVAGNGVDVMYWRVPGSQVVTGDPKFLTGLPAYAAAPGPNGLIAIASPPEEGKKVKVTIVDVNGAQPKVVAEYPTDMQRISALAFSPTGTILAVADDAEGVVQLWNLK